MLFDFSFTSVADPLITSPHSLKGSWSGCLQGCWRPEFLDTCRMPLHHLSLSETLETLGQMWNSSSGLSKEIWVLLAGGMLGLNRRSVNKDNCRGGYGGAGAAAGRGLKEEDLDFVSWEGGTVVRPHNDSSGVKWITSWRI